MAFLLKITSCFKLPRPDLSTCIEPWIFQYATSTSHVLAEGSGSDRVHLSLGQDEAIKGFCESRTRRSPLNFDN